MQINKWRTDGLRADFCQESRQQTLFGSSLMGPLESLSLLAKHLASVDNPCGENDKLQGPLDYRGLKVGDWQNHQINIQETTDNVP